MHTLIGPQEHYGKQNMYIIMHATYNSFEFNLFGSVCAGETGTSGISLPDFQKQISFWPLPCFPSDTCINRSIQEKKQYSDSIQITLHSLLKLEVVQKHRRQKQK